MGRLVACMVAKKTTDTSVRKSEIKIPLGRPEYRWQDNNKIGFKTEIRRHALDSSGSR
jgi:hypothetical protein